MEDGRGSSGIGRGKSIGLAEGILLPTESVDSNRSRPHEEHLLPLVAFIISTQFDNLVIPEDFVVPHMRH